MLAERADVAAVTLLIVAYWLDVLPTANTFVVCPKKSPAISATLMNVEFASRITALATLLVVSGSPLACLPYSLNFSGTVKLPGLSPCVEFKVIVAFAPVRDSNSIIVSSPPTAATLTTPLATEKYLLPPLLTSTTSIAPATALPVTLASITTGILSDV